VRVLWLTPVQLPGAKGRDATSGGWMEALRGALESYHPEIELTIASRGSVRHEPFSQGNAQYLYISGGPAKGRLGRVWERWSPADAPQATIEDCRRIVREAKPDLVHVHGSESFLGLALEGLDLPAVISLQGIMHAYVRHATIGFGLLDWMKLTATRESLHGYGLLNTVRQYESRARAERAVFGLCGSYLGRTDWDRAVLRAIRPDASYYQSEEILNGVFYDQVWEDPGAEAPIFCTSGSSPLKGLETLLDALLVLRRATGRPARLRIAGHVHGGPLWPIIKRRLDDPGLRGAVDLLGVLGPGDVARELRGASLYVQPSHIDNSPNALCEAMLVGLPCVAAFVGGIPSLVTHGETGLLYHDREPVMLAQAIERLLGDRPLAVAMGEAARQLALRRHDAESVAHGVAEIYEDVRRRGARWER
jgi:glycosyltransferase involved in cell wall biosynthesis